MKFFHKKYRSKSELGKEYWKYSEEHGFDYLDFGYVSILEVNMAMTIAIILKGIDF